MYCIITTIISVFHCVLRLSSSWSSQFSVLTLFKKNWIRMMVSTTYVLYTYTSFIVLQERKRVTLRESKRKMSLYWCGGDDDIVFCWMSFCSKTNRYREHFKKRVKLFLKLAQNSFHIISSPLHCIYKTRSEADVKQQSKQQRIVSLFLARKFTWVCRVFFFALVVLVRYFCLPNDKSGKWKMLLYQHIFC